MSRLQATTARGNVPNDHVPSRRETCDLKRTDKDVSTKSTASKAIASKNKQPRRRSGPPGAASSPGMYHRALYDNQVFTTSAVRHCECFHELHSKLLKLRFDRIIEIVPVAYPHLRLSPNFHIWCTHPPVYDHRCVQSRSTSMALSLT